MKNNDWFKHEKDNFFKKEKTSMFKDKSVPKLKKIKSKEDFSPEKALKVVGGLAVLGAGVAVVTDILEDI